MSADTAHSTDHESFIKTPQQLIVVGVLAFVVPVILLIMLAKFVIGSVGTEPQTAEAVAARIKPVAQVTVSEGGAGGARSGEEIVKAVCSGCHATGAAGAPKIGDKGQWSARIAHGLPEMLKVAIKGKGGMPPKGGSDASDFELARAIVYMANQSGGSLKEPAEPAPAKGAAAAKK